MTLFAANLSMMFNEYEFTDRFAAAANAGFKAVEYLFPYSYSASALSDALNQNKLQQVLFNSPPGDWDAGERGLASLPGREDEFQQGIKTALEYAKALQCPRIHAMAGLLADGADKDLHTETYIKNLKAAAILCKAQNIDLLIEPINPINMPGYFLNNFQQACDILDSLNAEGAPVKLQFDFFHCYRIHGDVIAWIEKCKRHIAHFQIAGVPDRHEPDIGELPYQEIIAAAAQAGFKDLAIGCEYIPSKNTEDGLGWLKTV